MTDRSQASERVLDTAEALFMQHGYTTVKLKDIAQHLNMRQASLYYHVPGGKEDLYVAVMERKIERTRKGLEDAVQSGGDSWFEQLRAASHWLLEQTPMDLNRMINSDMPAISDKHADRLMQQAYEAIQVPLIHIFQQAEAERGKPLPADIQLMAGTFVSILGAIHSVKPEWTRLSRADMADQMITLLAEGVYPR